MRRSHVAWSRVLAALAISVLAAVAAALELHFVDVGQGDAVVIVAPDGRAVVYDGGPAADTLYTYLRRVGIEQVVLVIASHAHADHIGGLPAVIDAYVPAFVLDNGVPHTTRAFERYLHAVERSGAQLLTPERRTITLGEVRLHVLPSPGRPEWGHNDNSVGLVVEYGAFRATLTGDAEAQLFEWWLATVPEMLVDVQVHKASHHGSDEGDTRAALIGLRPELVVVSARAGNRYGHPHESALARYAEVGAALLRTDLHGTVRIEVEEDGSYRVTTERSAPAPTAEPARAAASAPSACIDLNEAGLAALELIVHIGHERAAAIAGLRPFTTVEQRSRVDGIGPARLRDIVEQGLACVR